MTKIGTFWGKRLKCAPLTSELLATLDPSQLRRCFEMKTELQVIFFYIGFLYVLHQKYCQISEIPITSYHVLNQSSNECKTKAISSFGAEIWVASNSDELFSQCQNLMSMSNQTNQ